VLAALREFNDLDRLASHGVNLERLPSFGGTRPEGGPWSWDRENVLASDGENFRDWRIVRRRMANQRARRGWMS
jgi:hypothetical protein